MTAMKSRLAQELKQLQLSPPPGVCAWPVGDKLNELEAQVCGPTGTVYEGGVFRLSVHLPQRYPFEPPKVRFITQVYHPNIDNGGRICLDTLNMPPKGAWKPSLNISTVLASIGLLLGEPNSDDGLMTDVTQEYKHDRASFDAKARQMTASHAQDPATKKYTAQKTEQVHLYSRSNRQAEPDAQGAAVSASSSSASESDTDDAEESNGEGIEPKKPRICY